MDQSHLSWVHSHIAEVLSQARVRLVDLVERDQAPEAFHELIHPLHQVRGALEMVELYGAAMLVEELETVTDQLAVGRVERKQDAYELLMRSILQLPDYLERCQVAGVDNPILLITLLNDLRALRGAPLFSESGLFSPDLGLAVEDLPERASITRATPDAARDYLRRLRPYYQKGLVNWFTGRDGDGGLRLMADVLAHLEKVSGRTGIGPIWWIGGGVLEALREGGLETSSSLKLLLGQLDRQIKRLLDEGATLCRQAPPVGLHKNLLYYVASASSSGPRVRRVRELYALKGLLPTLEGTAGEDVLRGVNLELAGTVSRALHEDLESIKDVLDIFVRSEQSDLNNLEPLMDSLNRVADTLGLLGLGGARYTIQRQASAVWDIIQRGELPDDAELLPMARAILVVEGAVKYLGHWGLETALQNDADQDDKTPAGQVRLSNVELSELTAAVMREAKAETAAVKDAFNRYIKAPDNLAALSDVPARLNRVKGSLQMLSELDAGELTGQVADYINMAVETDGQTLSGETLEGLADVLTHMEIYLDAIGTPGVATDSLREHWRIGLAALPPQPDEEAEQEGEPEADQPPGIEGEVVEEISVETEEILLEPAPEEPPADVPEAEELGEEAEEITLTAVPVESDLDDDADADDFSDSMLASEDDEPADNFDALFNEMQDDIEDESSPAEGPDLPDGIDEEILEIFLEEAGEVQEEIGQQLPRWKANPDDEEALITVRRSFHTLKGSGRLVGAELVGEFAWSMEQLLNQVIEKVVVVVPAMFDLLEEAYAALPLLVDAFSKGQVPAINAQALMERAEKLASPGVAEGDDEGGPGNDGGPLSGDGGPGHGGGPQGDEGTGGEHNLSGVLPEPGSGDEAFSSEALQAVFTEETQGHVHGLREQLRAGDDLDPNELLRLVHTLNGSASMARAEGIAALFCAWEGYLEGLRAGVPGQLGQRVLGDSVTWLETLLAEQELACVHPPDELYHAVLALIPDDEGTAGGASDEPQLDAGPEAMPAGGESVRDWVDEALALVHQAEVHLQAWLAAESAAVMPQELRDTCANLAETGDAPIPEEYQALSAGLAELLNAESLSVAGGLGRELVQEGLDRLAVMLDLVCQEQQPLAADEWLARAAAAAEPEPRTTVEGDLEEDEEQELSDIFLEEAEELDTELDGLIRRWREAPEDRQIIEALQRTLHTFKGGARMARIRAMGDLSHAVESLLTRASDGALRVDDAHIDVVEATQDSLERMAGQARAGQTPEQDEPLLARVGELLEQREPGPSAMVSTQVGEPIEASVQRERAEVAGEPGAVDSLQRVLAAWSDMAQTGDARGADSTERIQVPAELLDSLVNYAGELSINRAQIEQRVNDFRGNLGEMDDTVGRLRDQLRRLEIEAESQIMFRYEESLTASEEEFDPLEFDRFSMMQQLSRGLLESTSDLESLHGLLEDVIRDSEALLIQQSRMNSDLQEGLVKTRLLPFAQYVPRLRRVVRQTAQELGKRVELLVEGQYEELDSAILSRIIAPLEHMLRNAVDHGIEAEAQRRAAGKSSTANIRLGISREGAEVILQVEDDGAGLDLGRIRESALQRGLITAEDELSDDEVADFVLYQSLSTARKVSQISGRGVGMDVVNTAVKQLGGSLDIRTRSGDGARFTIRLPTSLAISEALLVMAGDETFAIPLVNVEAIVRLSHQELETILAMSSPVYQRLGQDYRFADLAKLLGISEPGIDADKSRHPALLIRIGEQRTALKVEALSGRQEIVIKPLGEQIGAVPWLSGATIRGDGSVVLILDIPNLLRHGAAVQAGTESAGQPREPGQIPLVMVVDDSITVRKVTQRFLSRHGMEVLTARDGVEALAMLLEKKPDLMLLDVEMPRMDGYELATTVRRDAHLMDLPIIMITSRIGQKHAERAARIGVNKYLGKPYKEAELLNSIQELLSPH